MRHSFSETEQEKFAIECGKKNAAGEPLGPDCFPLEIYGAPNAKAKDYQLLDLFYAGSYWAVSKVAADIFCQFDRGDGGLYPVEIFESDRKTPVSGEWFCINFGNRKESFLPDASRNLSPFVRGIWTPPIPGNYGDIALSSAALSGPDIWIEPRVFGAIFFSANLGAALKKGNAVRGLFLKKCRVI